MFEMKRTDKWRHLLSKFGTNICTRLKKTSHCVKHFTANCTSIRQLLSFVFNLKISQGLLGRTVYTLKNCSEFIMWTEELKILNKCSFLNTIFFLTYYSILWLSLYFFFLSDTRKFEITEWIKQLVREINFIVMFIPREQQFGDWNSIT